jgi:protein-L-isoaspartate(D-aspartate) O-methyltransferase
LNRWLGPSALWIGWWSLATLSLATLSSPSAQAAQRPDNSREARAAMVQSEVVGRGIRDPRVIAAMGEVPRHLFLPAEERKSAYQDAALPIGNGQTITSPYVVAFMTEQLEPKATDKVLEIGTGSGYQASILSQLVSEVYTIEIVEPLGRRAAKTIQQLDYDNVHTRIGDGYLGWPEHAPFDKIIVTCSPEKVPQPLVDQLKEGGRLVVPLGERFQQMLYLFRKTDGVLQQEKLESTFFVPMTGEAEALRERKDDTSAPQVVNGTFEEVDGASETPGWFYARQARIVADGTAPEGQRHLVLTNGTAGQSAHVLQAIGVNGRTTKELTLTVRRRTRGVAAQTDKARLPRVELAFYDETRALIRTVTLGPWDGDRPWAEEHLVTPVPGRARFAMLAVAMFGGTGEFAVDELQVTASKPDQ